MTPTLPMEFMDTVTGRIRSPCGNLRKQISKSYRRQWTGRLPPLRCGGDGMSLTRKIGLVILGGILAILLQVTIWFVVERPIVAENVIMSNKMPYRWVVIEFERPDCPPLPESWLGYRYEIPESGYLCTSSEPWGGQWVYLRFYLADSNRQIRIDARKLIHKESANWLHSCGAMMKVFWYGPEEDITGSYNEAIWQARPDCNPNRKDQ